MSSKDNSLWLKAWRDHHTDFHQSKFNDFLVRFWPKKVPLQLNRVLVPLCGKSLDMIWLSQQGFQVLGIELSPLAVAAFFKENNLIPEKREVGKFTLWKAGNISILCGNYFKLKSVDIGEISWVYDRAALTALPEAIRVSYVKKMIEIIPLQCKIFLLTIEDAEPHLTLEQALGVDAEIQSLYGKEFAISLLHVDSVMEKSPLKNETTKHRAEYKVYQFELYA